MSAAHVPADAAAAAGDPADAATAQDPAAAMAQVPADAATAQDPAVAMATDRPDAQATAQARAATEAKAALRRRLLAARRERRVAHLGRADDADPARDTGRADGARTRLLLELPELAGARTVAAYVNLPDEPGTAGLLEILRARAVRVLLPVLEAGLDLRFRVYGGRLVAGRRGTLQPPDAPDVPLAAADVVVVPALAVDAAGHRLGRGGGSYDRALRRVRPDCLVVALLDDGELLEAIPAQPHDRPVGVAVTPVGVVRLPTTGTVSDHRR